MEYPRAKPARAALVALASSGKGWTFRHGTPVGVSLSWIDTRPCEVAATQSALFLERGYRRFRRDGGEIVWQRPLAGGLILSASPLRVLNLGVAACEADAGLTSPSDWCVWSVLLSETGAVPYGLTPPIRLRGSRIAGSGDQAVHAGPRPPKQKAFARYFAWLDEIAARIERMHASPESSGARRPADGEAPPRETPAG